MKQRGRKSIQAVATDTPYSAVERPEPPVELTPEQRLEWISVVNAMRADWFPAETHSVLAQYCKHVVSARRVADLILQEEQSDEFDLGEYEKLLKMQERESRIIVSLATKMRLTQQASYHSERTKAAKAKAKSPWES